MGKITGSESSNQSIKRQNYIKNFRQKFPEESKLLSDGQIISIMNNEIDEVEYKDGQRKFLLIELTPWESLEYKGNTMTVSSSGRYSIFDRKSGWKQTYYAADGTKLKQDYFKKAEEEYRINKPVESSETIVTLPNYRNCPLDRELEKYFNAISYKIMKAECHNGLFASLWSGIKNLTGIGDSSNKVKEQLAKEKQIIKEKGYIDGFTAITGLKATPKNIEDFKNGKVKLKSEQMLDAYKEGQKMATDVEGDLISGVAAFGVYSAAVAAAPFTAGASIAVGAAAAAAAAAIVKPLTKSIASMLGGYDYEGFKKDAVTGAFSGVLAPVSAGLGGAVGKTTAKALGVQTAKHIGKTGLEQTAKTGLKETITNGLLNPAGYKYTANSFIKREAALASELVTDGVTAGTVDGGFRAGVENNWQLKEMGKGALIGGVGGFILSPVIGRTLRTTGKLGHKFGLNEKEYFQKVIQEIEVSGNPIQKEMAAELKKNDFTSAIRGDIEYMFYPNKDELKLFGLGLGEYIPENEVNEVLKNRLNVIRQINENPEILNENLVSSVLRSALEENHIKDYNWLKIVASCNLKTKAAKLSLLKKQLLEHPELYLNGECKTAEAAKRQIETNLASLSKELFVISDVLDNETMNVFMRRRFDDVFEYSDIISSFSSEEIQIYRKLVNSVNADNTPFSSNQKIEFMDLIQAYKDNGLDISLISSSIKNGKVNIAELHKILLNKIFNNIGLSEKEIASIPYEKMATWDLKYIHLLASSISHSEDDTCHDLIKATMLDDFMSYIHNGSNDYGKANLKTKEIFEKKGWNYEAYIKPAKENEMKLVIKDQNVQQLAEEGRSFVRIVEQLMQPPMDKIVKKQLSKYFQGDKFVIPEKTLKSKENLYAFMEGVLKNLDNIKKRAESNLSNPEKATGAKNMVTKFENMKRISESVKKIRTEDSGLTRTYDLTIKMIDRVPQKDIFQGNYSTCCIGQGEFNDRMANYLMNTAYNMIELVDNKTGKTIGNALCYFVEDKKGNPYFIIDNIEINNAKKCSDAAGKELRSAITEYASRVAKQVTGKEDIHICMVDSYNDVPIRDLHSKSTKIKFIGDVETKHQYMDLFGGWESDFKGKCKLLFLK